MEERRWYQRIDKWFWAAVVVGLVLRIAIVSWPLQGGCVRDECSYQLLARKIAAGQGLQPQMGWLWAPVFPYLLAAFTAVFHTPVAIKAFQVPLSALTVALVGWFGRQVDPRTGRIAAWIAALHPTLAFFASTMWAETVYTALLLGTAAATLRAREGSRRWAAGAGVLLGLTILTRGIATLMPPLFLLALFWPTQASWSASWTRLRGSAATMMLAAALVVAPYSIKASVTHGGLIISDATAGQQFFFGNNDFEPVTFDYGNGIYSDFAIGKVRLRGRLQCDRKLGVVAWNQCEVQNGVEFIANDPMLFVERIPLRLAQLLNPHTFMTRHVRWGRYVGLPWWMKEGISAWIILYSFALIWGGAAGLWLRGRGALGVVSTTLLLYYLAVISCFFGISRFRLPLEPLLIVWLAALIANPRSAVPVSHARKLGAALTVLALIPLTLWFLPHGLPIPH